MQITVLKTVSSGSEIKNYAPAPKISFEERRYPLRAFRSSHVQICNYTLLFMSSVLQYRPVNCALNKKTLEPQVPDYHDDNVLSCFCCLIPAAPHHSDFMQ